MSNVGITIIGWIVTLVGFVASAWNSYLVMVKIEATTLMWVLWVGSFAFIVLGSVIAADGKCD